MIPNLPTDNLYKFIALSGVAMLGTFIYLTASLEKEFMDMYLDSDERASVAEAKGEISDQQIERLKTVIENSVARLEDESLNPPNATELQQSQDEIKELEDKLQFTIRESRIETARLDVDVQRLKALSIRSQWVFAIGISICIVALIMALVGFKLWYERVQKPMDEMIRLQLAEKQKPTP